MSRRYECYGMLQCPETCTYDVAWSVFRRAVRRQEYWLSFQELQLVGALHQTYVRVFRATQEGVGGDQHYLESYSAHVCIERHQYLMWSKLC